MLLTSEMETSDDEIIDMYRGLWRIEESFKVTKSELEARLVYVWTKEHIEAHFLTCFVALTIARILENKLERKYSIGTILESLSKAKCSLIQQNYYLFDYYDEVLKDIERVTVKPKATWQQLLALIFSLASFLPLNLYLSSFSNRFPISLYKKWQLHKCLIIQHDFLLFSLHL